MLIRDAVTADADAIGRLHVRGWTVGYAGIVPAEFLATLSVRRSTMQWLQGLADITRPQTIVAVDDDGIVTGFASFGHNRDGLGLETGELHGLYVDPDAWRRGIGGALLTEAETRLALGGLERAILWTLADRGDTRRFFEHRGWAVRRRYSAARVRRQRRPIRQALHLKGAIPTIGRGRSIPRHRRLTG